MSNPGNLHDLSTKCSTDAPGEVPASNALGHAGEIIGQYRLLDLLGSGGMGTVYRAAHTLIDRVVALKLLKPELATNPTAVQRFLQEAQACVRLRHNGIVAVYDVGQHGDVVYMTMALVEGQNLADYVATHGPLSPNLALVVAARVAQALIYAHARGVIHRDIKPRNIMFNEPQTVTLLDMGIARVLDIDLPILGTGATDNTGEEPSTDATRLTARSKLMGTLAYMAPEQACDPRQADARSDIYSLGCTLYYLLSGKQPFQGQSELQTLDNHLAGCYRPLREHLPHIPPVVAHVAEKMLARRPEDRFQTAAAVAKVLLDCASQYYRQDFDLGALATVAPSIAGYEFWASTEPLGIYNTEFHGFVSLPDGKVVVLAGDAAGKDTAAAQAVTWLTRHLRAALESQPNVAEAMSHLNRPFCKSFGMDRIATLVLCLLDSRAAKVTVVNAGYAGLMIRRVTKALEGIPDESCGLPLGVMEDYSYEPYEIGLCPGDMVLLWSDDATDSLNLQDNIYGSRPLLSLLRNVEGGAQAVCEAILQDLHRFRDGRPQDFGWTIVGFGRLKNDPA
jgi:serine/threonine protein kinase